jgi:hypothetical protein
LELDVRREAVDAVAEAGVEVERKALRNQAWKGLDFNPILMFEGLARSSWSLLMVLRFWLRYPQG